MSENSTSEDDVKKKVVPREKPRMTLFRRSFSILGHLFHRTSKEDFERKLRNLSKEEAAVHTRIKQRSQLWRKLARGLIIYSIIIELLTVGIAIISTRAPELTWQMRTVRILPLFVFPAVATLVYTTLARYYSMRERKDQKSLERLRNERQAKIDELKERTSYYLTQQLIQKYDSDVTAKAAAARVLASKHGTDAGINVSGEPSQPSEMVRDTMNEDVNSTGIRRRTAQKKSVKDGASSSQPIETIAPQSRSKDHSVQRHDTNQLSSKPSSTGWVGRIAAMLVGEDPTQSYALICVNCNMHNGLARKEEFHSLAYYCPHCNTLNKPNALQPSQERSESTSVTRDETLILSDRDALASQKS